MTSLRAKKTDPPKIHAIFSEIASTYDFLNHLLSFNLDRLWRREAVKVLTKFKLKEDDLCLDLCSGTGDLSIELHRRLSLPVVSADFCRPMLVKSSEKLRSLGFDSKIYLAEADALYLPFGGNTFASVTIAFGLRNLENREEGLREIYRVLRPGGSLVILEFSKSSIPGFRQLFGFYFRYILPVLGSLISRTVGPYQYLHSSVHQFPSQGAMVELLERAGFRGVGFTNLSGGVAAVHWGHKRD